MNTEKFTWKGYEWQTRERWGYVHHDKPWAMYSKYCVEIDKNDNLILYVKDGLTNYDSSIIFPMGLVSTTKNNPMFKFGTYKWTAKLPRGKHLWPALWMWSWDSWPPEIDVMEAWSNDSGGYLLKDHKTMRITNCYHYDEKDTHEYGCLRLKDCWWRLPQYTFNDYMLVWKPGCMEFHFNKRLIRRITDRFNLKWIENHCQNGMNIVMNLHPTKEYKDGDMKTPLIIKNFEYIPS